MKPYRIQELRQRGESWQEVSGWRGSSSASAGLSVSSNVDPTNTDWKQRSDVVQVVVVDGCLSNPSVRGSLQTDLEIFVSKFGLTSANLLADKSSDNTGWRIVLRGPQVALTAAHPELQALLSHHKCGLIFGEMHTSSRTCSQPGYPSGPVAAAGIGKASGRNSKGGLPECALQSNGLCSSSRTCSQPGLAAGTWKASGLSSEGASAAGLKSDVSHASSRTCPQPGYPRGPATAAGTGKASGINSKGRLHNCVLQCDESSSSSRTCSQPSQPGDPAGYTTAAGTGKASGRSSKGGQLTCVLRSEEPLASSRTCTQPGYPGGPARATAIGKALGCSSGGMPSETAGKAGTSGFRFSSEARRRW